MSFFCRNVSSTGGISKLAGRKMTHEEYKQKLYGLRGDEYTLISEYTGSKDKVKVIHSKCGNIHEARADGMLKGSNCKFCRYNKLTKTHDEYIEDVQKVHGDAYKVTSQYIGAHDNIEVLHMKCGRTRSVNANSVLQGKRCVFCYNEGRVKTTEEFKEEVYRLEGDDYVIESRYERASQPILITHNVDSCMKTFRMSPNSFLSAGQRCPTCAFSKGEDNVRKVLEGLNLDYIHEKEFDGLVNVRPLRYDFYIEELNLLIEFDGIHHYEPVEHFGGIKYFNYIKRNDAKKNQYCKDNNINLLRIPYTEMYNEEEIITTYIEELEINNTYNRVMGNVTKELALV